MLYVCLSEPVAVQSVTLAATSSSVQISWTTDALNANLPHRVTVEKSGTESLLYDMEETSSSAMVTTGIIPSTSYTVSVYALLQTPDATDQGTLTSDAVTELVTTSKSP